MKNVVIIGPAHPLRGGLASFNQRLANEFVDMGWNCSIFSFSLQYPGFLFPGTTQYSSDPPPANLVIHSIINSVNPLNWLSVGRRLRKMAPDLIVVRYWLPFMGPALGSILRIAGTHRNTKVVAITDNVLPHEKRPGDKMFTKYFLKACDGYVTMSDKVMRDLRTFEPTKPAIQVLHPLYDNFGEPISKAIARGELGIDEDEKILLFFGFIRRYKGLDILLQAMKIVKERAILSGVKCPLLLVAGEYYEDAAEYNRLIKELDIEDVLILRTDFIADARVRTFLCAADVVVQPYRNATQSGVTPLAYHFEKPMIVTNVGSLPDLVPDHRVGLVCDPTPGSIAAAIFEFYELGENFFIPHLREEKKKYSWKKLVDALVKVGDS